MNTNEAYDWAISELDEDATFRRLNANKSFRRGMEETNRSM
jgi:hypothetical protein